MKLTIEGVGKRYKGNFWGLIGDGAEPRPPDRRAPGQGSFRSWRPSRRRSFSISIRCPREAAASASSTCCAPSCACC
jgi:hypothetical protein